MAHALFVGIAWAALAAFAMGTAAVTLTNRPATVPDDGDEVVHRSGPHGPMWGLVLLAAGSTGAAAGGAGFIWRYKRPN
jgi:hypothetical protein